jgi:hypothetical protein
MRSQQENRLGHPQRLVRTYLKRDMYTVNGYLKRIDAELIASLAAWQTHLDIVGGLVEIGVHHGRLFFILALSRGAREQALAIDLFEDDMINRVGYAGGRSRAFVHHAARLRIPVNDREVLKGDSLTLQSHDIVDRVGQVRLFSIDGGHMYRHVENDLILALESLSLQGVVAVDDFCNAEWPEVTFATYDFLRAHRSELVPAIATRHKVYLSRPTMADAYGQYARHFAQAYRNVHVSSVEIDGRNVPYLAADLKSRLLDEFRSKLSAYASRLPFIQTALAIASFLRPVCFVFEWHLDRLADSAGPECLGRGHQGSRHKEASGRLLAVLL